MNPPTSLAAMLKPVQPGLSRMREVLAAQIGDGSPAVRDMTDHVGRFQGKQLRGALVLLIGEATGNSTDEHATIAAIVEMIHLATLVHDDILDGAKVRRKVACVNERWDNQVAVLLGDFLYARAFALSTELSSRLCSRLLSETTRRICVGEIEQSTRRYDFELAQERYEAIAGAKTATLYAAACELGACYPAGNEELGAAMRAFGWELGLSFQIVDDCLDLAGDERRVGKSLGTDLSERKMTLPLIRLLARVGPEKAAEVRALLGDASIADPRAALAASVDFTPDVQSARATAEQFVRDGLAQLDALLPSPSRTTLRAMGEFVLERDK